MTAANDGINANDCKRSQMLGNPVISQGTATKIGLVDQVWVDLERKQALVLGVRQEAFSGVSRPLELSQVAALGKDAILVSNEDVFDDLELEGLVKVIGSEVVTEAGIRLGKVKDFTFNPKTGALKDLILSTLGIPILSGYVDTTYLMSVDEIASVGSRRIIAVAGAENRLVIEQENLLRRWFSVGVAPWEASAQRALPSSTFEEEIEEEVFNEGYEEEYPKDDEIQNRAPAYEERTYQEPAYEEPVYEEPPYEEPPYEEPVYEEPPYEEEVVYDPAPSPDPMGEDPQDEDYRRV